MTVPDALWFTDDPKACELLAKAPFALIVGFEIDQKHEREGKLVAASLKAGNARIVMGRDDGAKGWDRVKGAGCSLQFMTAGDVDAIAKRIKEHGGTLDAEPADMPWGVRQFSIKDPDGFKLVISAEARR